MKFLITILLIFVILLLPRSVKACDICGCGVGNNYIGILPEFQKKIIGIRYRYNSMLTHLGAGGSTTHLTTREHYHITEVWGGWNITRKIRIMASVPYSFNQKTNQGNTDRKNGIGDMSISGFYQLLNKRNTVSRNPRLLVQSFWVGGGIKLATGKYNTADKSSTGQTANLFQLGTGSYDFNIGAMYDIRLQDAGINVNTNYKINTANKYNYQYGDKFSLNAQAYYKFRTKKNMMLAPNAGVQYETAQKDRDDIIRVLASGGSVLLGNIGFETAFTKFAVGANYQIPLQQDLAHKMVKAGNRLMVHISMAL